MRQIGANYIRRDAKVCVKAQLGRNKKCFVKFSFQTNLTQFIGIVPNSLTVGT